MDPSLEAARTRSPFVELGIVLEPSGDELHGSMEVVPEMWVPGSTGVRTSILATWADIQLGLLALQSMAPRVPVTLELDVHLFDEVDGTPTIEAVAHVSKAGSSIQVLRIELSVGAERVGFGHAMFMAAPDARLTLSLDEAGPKLFNERTGRLTRPYAERVGCERTGVGTAVLPHRPELVNASQTMNGGALALLVEEAALSADPAARPLASLQLRYVRPVRTGPAVATASVQRGLGEVEVRDAATDTVALLATTRSAHA